MPNYNLFSQFLEKLHDNNFECEFKEIERIIKGDLPPSAYAYKEWWSNNPSHPLMKVILKNGFRQIKLDLKSKKASFVRTREVLKKSTESGFSMPTVDLAWADFEITARHALEHHLSFKLASGKIDINGKTKSFDLVNKAERIVGDVKNYTITSGGNRPSAKYSVLNEYVWLMQLVEQYSGHKWTKLLVIGEDYKTAKQYAIEFDKWLDDVNIFFSQEKMA